MIYEEGVHNLCIAIVQQAMDDVEGILKAEYGRQIGRSIPGSIVSDSHVNMAEIRNFMREEIGYYFDTDGEAMLDRFIRYARNEKIPKEWGYLRESV